MWRVEMGAEESEVLLIRGGRIRWGTWLELLLAGAVMRYGTDDWNLVADELRARTDCPSALTPEVCKDKYEGLQNRYSGCKTWFEELRKKRMKELKQALKQSENSIGSLESKLESLKAENVEGGCLDQTESPVHSQKSEGRQHYSFGKEIRKDESSAGSFTCEAFTNCSKERQVPASHSSERDKISIGEFYSGLGGTVRKRRGKRKRKGCSRNNVKEDPSVGESRYLDSNGARDWNRCSTKDGANYLFNVFSSISEHKCASVFRHRLDSQKRRRYKKLVRRHMDFDTIGSRIASHSLVSIKELFRDLLLLANNALVFYSKSTREYKSAQLLRDLTTKTLRQHLQVYWSKAATSTNLSSNTLLCSLPVKPRCVRPSNQKLRRKAINGAGKSATNKTSKQSKKASPNANIANAVSSPSVQSSAMTKKVSVHRKNVRRKTLAHDQVM